MAKPKRKIQTKPQKIAVVQPALPSLLSEKKTSIRSVKTLWKDFIWIIPNFLSPQECDNFIQWVESPLNKDHVDYMHQPATKWNAARQCHRCSQENRSLAQQVLERLLPHLSQCLDGIPRACNANIRLYKYEPGHAFGKHYDDTNDTPDGRTTHTILIYLSCNYRGGATRFFSTDDQHGDTGIAYTPDHVGSLLLHLHGEQCLPHQADPVTDGIKYILRTDLISIPANENTNMAHT